MTGDEWPSPGMAVFHAMFSVALHFKGTVFSVLEPSPRGPRQPGQFSAFNCRARMSSRNVIRMARV